MCEHNKSCEVCELAASFIDNNRSREEKVSLLKKHTTTRWIGGYTADSVNPIGTVLSYPQNGKKGIAFFHYSWSFIWFCCALTDKGKAASFFDDFVCILVEEVANHMEKLLPFFIQIKKAYPHFTPVFSVVSDQNLKPFKQNSFLTLTGAADAWINTDYWKKGDRTHTEKPYDVFLASTGAHNNRNDVKKVRQLLELYVLQARQEKVALVYYDGEDQAIENLIGANPNVSWVKQAVDSNTIRALYRESKSVGLMSVFEGGSRYLAEATNCGCLAIFNQEAQFHHVFSKIQSAGGKATQVYAFWDLVRANANRTDKEVDQLGTNNEYFSAQTSQKKLLELLILNKIEVVHPEKTIYLQPEITQDNFQPFPKEYNKCLPVVLGSYSAAPNTLPEVNFERVYSLLEL